MDEELLCNYNQNDTEMTMPPQKPGKSEQSVQTPNEFMWAVKNLLNIGAFSYDLAAEEHNAQAIHYFTKEQDALKQDWAALKGWLWLNPPYAKLYPWTEKAWKAVVLGGAKIAVLVPASTGTEWWTANVSGLAHILYLKGRITFVGHTTAYPKDLALLLYRPTVIGGHSTWDWRAEKE
jgi:phage N-6-adenine-methyltransferase